MITVSEAVKKMIDRCAGDQYDINHFLKVWAYAKTIGEEEGLDTETQLTLELSAIVHDIACPELRKKHGSAPGNLQEIYGPPMARTFYEDSGLDPDTIDRICFLVAHHHTFDGIDGMDWQILLEADFLVNAGELAKYHEVIGEYRKNVFKTATGLSLLNAIY